MVDKVEKEFFARLEKLEIERNGLKQKLIEMTAECNRLDELLRESDKRLKEAEHAADVRKSALLSIQAMVTGLRVGQ